MVTEIKDLLTKTTQLDYRILETYVNVDLAPERRAPDVNAEN